ncbi:RhuM family protein [Veillonella sp. VA142]|uniref:RhuM family protein n=1 Tax=Veillonella sp. VA142 TaxID=741834 RepID=UPI000F8E1131|nr:RhuM family protein [Veillonella sp. VA142]
MNKDLIIYNTEDGKAKISLTLQDGTVWLNQLQIAELFQTTKQNISKHIKAIFADGELDEKVVVNYQLTATKHGAIEGKTQHKPVAFYNLDMILAIGYRVRSPRGIQFRLYASTILKEYLEKGFAMDDERLKEAQIFFRTVQNKLHYAVHHHTAAELVYDRVDRHHEFLGLTTFKGELPTRAEAKVAKNYLSETELLDLNQLVSGYLDFAERKARREEAMTMADWVAHIDMVLASTGEKVLQYAGHISKTQMEHKVDVEYNAYVEHTLTRVERDYLEEIKHIENIAKKGGK